jgi:N-acetylglutamate synthase-like GNAT family acetyltransferase
MSQTDEYERLVKFFVENGLEFDGDEEVDTDIIRCYKVTMGQDVLIAGLVIAKREGSYILDGLAVDADYRKHKVGNILLDKAKEVVAELGGSEIFIVARAPEFFRKYGFETVDPEGAPNFFECKQCPQYGISCHPEVMRLTV